MLPLLIADSHSGHHKFYLNQQLNFLLIAGRYYLAEQFHCYNGYKSFTAICTLLTYISVFQVLFPNLILKKVVGSSIGLRKSKTVNNIITGCGGIVIYMNFVTDACTKIVIIRSAGRMFRKEYNWLSLQRYWYRRGCEKHRGLYYPQADHLRSAALRDAMMRRLHNAHATMQAIMHVQSSFIILFITIFFIS